MKNNSIVINNFTFSNKRISAVKVLLWTSVSKNELPIDTLTARISYSGNYQLMSSDPYLLESSDGFRLFASDSDWDIDGFDITQCKYGDEIACYHKEMLTGKFFFEKYKRVSPTAYDISCISAIGLLDNTTHYGGIYTGQTTSEVLADIIANQITYVIDAALENVPVYGWLPIAARRENLHQLLFAQGISISHNADGIVRFFSLTKSAQKDIPANRIFSGGNMDYQAHATRVSVAEHSYIQYADDKQSTLFEGNIKSDPIITPKGTLVNGTIVEFSAPMHSLAVTGSRIVESGVNYAVLSAGAAKLTGREYTHTQRTVQAGIQESRSLVEVKDNEVSVTTATLVNVTNSDSVASRLMAYYGKVDVASQDIVVGSERPGDAVVFVDAFGEQSEGFIETVDITMSNIMRGTTKIAKGYDPPPNIIYTKYVILTTTQTFVIPDGVTKIGLVVIGGGQGGKSGEAGGRSSTISVSFNDSMTPAQFTGYGLGAGGSGGVGGQGGNGGKILQTSLTVSEGQSYAVSIGAGGAGASYNGSGNQGSFGSPTTFGAVSSEIGEIYERGYLDPFTGEFYGMSGTQGIAGGSGASGKAPSGSVSASNIDEYVDGSSITDEDGVTWRCGTTLSARPNRVSIENKIASGGYNLNDGFAQASVSNGLGGGAAAGSNGTSATTMGSATASGSGTRRLSVRADGVSGTSGATATKIPRKATRGNGGRGGYGGGGAGSPGFSVVGKLYGALVDSIYAEAYSGSSGSGGYGSTGGAGADGVVIIYY